MKSHITCAVAKCGNYGRKTSGIVYHRFPQDKVKQKEWISRCKRDDPINADTASICSEHFLPHDYKRDLQNELLGLPVKKRLLPSAVPSQHIPNWHGGGSGAVNQTINPRHERYKMRETRKSAIASLEKISSGKQVTNAEINTNIVFELPEDPTNTNIVFQLPEDELPEDELPEDTCMNKEINKLKVENEHLKKRQAEQEAVLNKCMDDLKKAQQYIQDGQPLRNITLDSPSQFKVKVNQEVRKILARCFTPGQINCLLQGNKQGKWNCDDIANAVKLRAISRKAYAYLRKCNIPLPSLSTLQKWSKEGKCRPGISEEVLAMLKATTVTLSSSDKLVL